MEKDDDVKEMIKKGIKRGKKAYVCDRSLFDIILKKFLIPQFDFKCIYEIHITVVSDRTRRSLW